VEMIFIWENGQVVAGADDLIQLIGGKVIVGKNITTSFKEVLSMKPEAEVRVKYGVWGIVVGAVIAMIIGFAFGGWTTSGTTKTMTQEAVLASQAAICVAQFMAQPNHAEKLKELAKIDSWKRAEFIEKGGWDKMPGQTEEADYAVSRACSDGLELLMKK